MSSYFSIIKNIIFLNTAVLLLFVLGCTSIAERNPVPAEFINDSKIPGLPEARFWDNEWPKHFKARIESFSDSEFQKFYSGIYNKPHSYLAFSGGGANGAYGAGILFGWSEAGTRPEFTLVTGISTGALAAPFAFLGSEYDDQLKTVYTTTTTKDVLKKRRILTAIFGDSFANTEPLKKLIAKYITIDVIEAIAIEHKKGRRLLVGTVNIDAGRTVIWNIGAIASSNYPNKVELIREVLRASAAIPIAFPPVVITIEANGKQYDELHVDGGTGAQVIVYPASIDWELIKKKLKVPGKPKLYVIRNSFLEPDYQTVKRRIIPIASRTIESLIRTQGIGDLYTIYALCKRDGIDFNLAYIPSKFKAEPTEGFDPVYMSKLFELGYQKGLNGYPWEKAPPDF